MAGPVDNLIDDSDYITPEQIIASLTTPENIRLKTEFPNVSAIEQIRVMAIWYLKSPITAYSSIYINAWLEGFELDQVSSLRKSRTELIDALRAKNEEKKAFMDRLLGSPK